jgi:hypothetical protein
LWTGTTQYQKALTDATVAIRIGKTVDQAFADLEKAVAAIVE